MCHDLLVVKHKLVLGSGAAKGSRATSPGPAIGWCPSTAHHDDDGDAHDLRVGGDGPSPAPHRRGTATRLPR